MSVATLFAEQSNIIDFPPGETVQGNNEWYTPGAYIEATRKVMGRIELDPASCETANRIVKAERYYTIKDDGLIQDWSCSSMWLNPPYGKLSNKSMLEIWIKKLVDDHNEGKIKQAILLATNNIEAPWFPDLWKHPICLVDHEVRFHHPQGIRKCHLFGTTLTYFGTNEQAFIDVFSEFGPVIPANTAVRRQKLQPLTLWQEGE